jgi:WD40 repeat protein
MEVMAYSPDASKLAVGSHDNLIYVYETQNYSLLGKLKGHNAYIVSIDWSYDNSYLRTVCGAHELLFWKSETLTQDTEGASNTVDTVWATSTARFGWLVEGIYPSGVDGAHINCVEFSNDGTLIVTGDDFGLVNLFRNPSRCGNMPHCLRGHSEHVMRVKFSPDDTFIYSVGGQDQTLIQWRRQ